MQSYENYAILKNFGCNLTRQKGKKMSEIGIGQALSEFLRNVALVDFDYLAVAYVGAVDG